jgi:radical SAM protein with 4Fe4S-binding SPASM domain
MKPYLSDERQKKTYFCEEPWIGVFSVKTNGDVIFCPCYAQEKIGNIHESFIQDIWNSDIIIAMREAFSKGELPERCRNQLCPVVVGDK